MRGAATRAIQELAGRANLSTTRGYGNISPAATGDSSFRSAEPTLSFECAEKKWRHCGHAIHGDWNYLTGKNFGAGYGDRTQVTRFFKVVMARDFWSEEFDPQAVVSFLAFSVVLSRPPISAPVLEIFWRRTSLR